MENRYCWKKLRRTFKANTLKGSAVEGCVRRHAMTSQELFREYGLTNAVAVKIERTVDILAPKENREFDEVHAEFLASNTHQAIQDTRSLMWYKTPNLSRTNITGRKPV